MDMRPMIEPKSDQLNSDDLISGPRTVRIRKVARNEDPQQPCNVFFEGDNGKPFRPCKSMMRVMVFCWGDDAAKYVGKSMTLYRDPAVMFGGAEVGGIRISHMSHLKGQQKLALTASRAKKAPYVVKPLQVDEGDQAEPDVDADPAHLEAARAAASNGKVAFTAWWSAHPDMRPSARTIMDELQKATAAADANAAPPADDDELPL